MPPWDLGGCSYGVVWLPIGVARCKVGKGGLDAAGCAPTALALGEGGMAKPSLGVRAPALRPPASAGRSMGAGDASCGRALGVCNDAGVLEEEGGCGMVRVICHETSENTFRRTIWAPASTCWG
jgi:hypothetical protein